MDYLVLCVSDVHGMILRRTLKLSHFYWLNGYHSDIRKSQNPWVDFTWLVPGVPEKAERSILGVLLYVGRK